MAEAAEQTVKTLQSLLEQKKESLLQKEDMIKKLRDQMEKRQQMDAETIASLRDQLAMTGNSTLSKLHEAASRMETSGARQTQGQRKANADLQALDRQSRAYVEEALHKKDKIIQDLRSQLESGKGSRSDIAGKLSDKDAKIADLEQDVNRAKEEASRSLARERVYKAKLDDITKKREADKSEFLKKAQEFKNRIVEFETRAGTHTEENKI